jgi:hypothetical protein
MEGEFMPLFSIRITNKEKKKVKYFCCVHSNWMTLDNGFFAGTIVGHGSVDI